MINYRAFGAVLTAMIVLSGGAARSGVQPAEGNTKCEQIFIDVLPQPGVPDIVGPVLSSATTTLGCTHYPRIAVVLQNEGDVTLEIQVADDGAVLSANVVQRHRSSFLNDAALKLARELKFSPATRNGIPVEVVRTIAIQFHLTTRVPETYPVH